MRPALHIICLTALSLLAVACREEVKPVPETKDRLTEAAMERLVAGPMEVVRTESLSAGEATFKRLLADTKLRKGPSSLDVFRRRARC